MQHLQKTKLDKKTIRLIYFVLFCVIVSRILIYIGFLLWKEKNAMDIGFWEAMSRFDTSWYKSIIENGYNLEPMGGDRGDSANWAFFPLFPVIIKLLHYVIPVNYDMLAFILNSVFMIFFFILAVKYIKLTRNDNTQAVIYVILMAFGMYNFYFAVLYTEALFVLLLAAFFYCMEKRRYLLMGIAGALASATRNLGVMLVFAVAVHYLCDYFQNNSRFSVKSFFGNLFGNVRLVLGTALIPMGLFSYMLYLYIHVGDSMAFVHIQRAWGKDFINPLRVLFNSLTNINSFVFYLSLVSVWGIYCVWLLICNKRFTEAVMAVIFVFVPLAASVDAMPRYLIGSFLPLLSFTDGIGKWPRSKIIALCTFSIVFGGVCLWGWFASEAFVM